MEHLSPPAVDFDQSETRHPKTGTTGTKKPPVPTGDERCLARGTTPLHHRAEPPVAFARHTCKGARLLCNGSLSTLLGAPALPTGMHGIRSERGSEVLFSVVRGPAFQLPRFSGPIPTGTCPLQSLILDLCIHVIRGNGSRQVFSAHRVLPIVASPLLKPSNSPE